MFHAYQESVEFFDDYLDTDDGRIDVDPYDPSGAEDNFIDAYFDGTPRRSRSREP